MNYRMLQDKQLGWMTLGVFVPVFVVSWIAGILDWCHDAATGTIRAGRQLWQRSCAGYTGVYHSVRCRLALAPSPG